MFSWFKKTPNSFTNYSFDGLKSVHMQLLRHRELSESSLVELLRVSSEFLIYGDQHTAQQFFFDYFCEKNMLALFVQIGEASPPHRVQVQLLQTLSLLVQNITTTTSLYYILSNNFINRLITCRNFQLEQEDVRDWYVTFLKALSIRLTVDTLQFFFNASTRTFPLYLEALKFRNCNEIQVQIAVKTVLLNVLRVPDDRMRRFLTHRQNMPYFIELVDQGQILALKMQGILNTTSLNTSQEDKLNYVIDATIDHWYYIQDILDVPLPDLSFMLGEWIFESYLRVFAAQSLLPNCQPGAQRVSTLLALFLLQQFFKCISHTPLLNAATYMLFHPEAIECSYMSAALGTGERKSDALPRSYSFDTLPDRIHSPRSIIPLSPSTGSLRDAVLSPRFILPLHTLQNIGYVAHSNEECSSGCYLHTRYATGEWPPEDVEGLPALSGNLFRHALIELIESSDLHLSLCASALLYEMGSNSNIDRSLLRDCQLIPISTHLASSEDDNDEEDSDEMDEALDSYDRALIEALLANLERSTSLQHVQMTLALLEQAVVCPNKPLLSIAHQSRLVHIRHIWAKKLEAQVQDLALWESQLKKWVGNAMPAPTMEWSSISPFHTHNVDTDAIAKYLVLYRVMASLQISPPLDDLAKIVVEYQQHESEALVNAFQLGNSISMAETSFLPCVIPKSSYDCIFCLLNVDFFVLVKPERDMTCGNVQILAPLYSVSVVVDTNEPSTLIVSIDSTPRVSLLFQSSEMAQQMLLHVESMKRVQIEQKSNAIRDLLS